MRRVLALLAALLSFAAAPGAAQYEQPDSSITIRAFDAELRVQPDGVVEVTESIRFQFRGQWRGILRDLSLRHRTAQGQTRKLDVELVGAADGAGSPLRWEAEDGDDSWTQRRGSCVARGCMPGRRLASGGMREPASCPAARPTAPPSQMCAPRTAERGAGTFPGSKACR